MNAYPQTWFKASQIIGGDVRLLVQGGVFFTRVFVERLVGDHADGATETMDFSYRGVDYEIDLLARDARALDALLDPVLAASRRKERRPVTRRATTETPSGLPLAKAVRAWAKNEGIEVSDRGRVAADVMKRYQDAHSA